MVKYDHQFSTELFAGVRCELDCPCRQCLGRHLAKPLDTSGPHSCLPNVFSEAVALGIMSPRFVCIVVLWGEPGPPGCVRLSPVSCQGPQQGHGFASALRVADVPALFRSCLGSALGPLEVSEVGLLDP